MKVIIETESGSTYHLDSQAMTWEKVKYIPRAATPDDPEPVRTGQGKLIEWPRFEVRQPLILLGPSLTPGGDYRQILTTLVTRIIQVDEEGDEAPIIPESCFSCLQIGDTVTRMLAGALPIELLISDITENLIVCGPWTFDKVTGAEIDEELGWGNIVTGSYLVLRHPLT